MKMQQEFVAATSRAQARNTTTLTGWNTVYFDFEVLVVPFVSVCDLGA